MSRNRHGLSRYIPEKIKKEVRERCGFGCVVCGLMIYQYEHFDPPFEDCESHNSEGITLLCGSCPESIYPFLEEDQMAKRILKTPHFIFKRL